MRAEVDEHFPSRACSTLLVDLEPVGLAPKAMSLLGAVPWWESRAGTVESLDEAQWMLLDPTSNLHKQLETVSAIGCPA